MKFILASTYALSTLCMVYSLTLRREDSEIYKSIAIECTTMEQANKCKTNMKAVDDERGQDKFSRSRGTTAPNRIFTTFLGTCAKANDVLAAIANCSVQECSVKSCYSDEYE